jgi:hypothetical protein
MTGTDVIRKWAAAAALIAVAVGGVGVGVFLITAQHDRQLNAAQPRTPVTATPSIPTGDEFTVGVLMSGQECDSAGECVYTYTIEPKYVGLHPLPTDELRVSYRVAGGHEPQDGAFTVRDNQVRYLKDVAVRGPAGATLSAEVLDVQPVRVQGPPATPTP